MLVNAFIPQFRNSRCVIHPASTPESMQSKRAITWSYEPTSIQTLCHRTSGPRIALSEFTPSSQVSISEWLLRASKSGTLPCMRLRRCTNTVTEWSTECSLCSWWPQGNKLGCCTETQSPMSCYPAHWGSKKLYFITCSHNLLCF